MRYLILNNAYYYLSRTAIAGLFCFLIYCIYFFSLPHVHIGNYTFNNPFQNFIDNLSLWLYLLIYVIVISILNIFILLMMSMYFTVRNEKAEKTRLKDQLVFTEKIIGYIFSQDSGDILSVEKHFKGVWKSLKKRKTIEVFFSDIIAIQDNIDEDLSEKYRDLFDNLKLGKYIPVFLFSKKLDKRIIALKIIACLNLKGYEDIIKKYSTSNNYVLRTVAMDTLIKLSETDHLEVLLSHEHSISMLDINVIVHGIEKNRKADIDYLSLLESDSVRIRVIGLLLIKIRNKHEYKDMVKPMLKSTDTLLKETAMEVFISFANTDEDFNLLIGIFRDETLKNKLLILDGLNSVESLKFSDFLNEVIANDEILLKIAALRILFKNDMSRFLSYENTADKNIIAAYNEIVDLI